MWHLIGEIIVIVLLTALLWFAIGWWVRSVINNSQYRRQEAEWSASQQSLRRARDDYRDQLEQQLAAAPTGAVITDSQRAQIAAHVKKLESDVQAGREQLQAMTVKLDAVGDRGSDRDVELTNLNERLQAALEAIQTRDERLRQLGEATRQGDSAAGDAALRARVEQQRAATQQQSARIVELSRSAGDGADTSEHAKLLNVIEAQKKTIANLNARVAAASNDDKIPRLEQSLAEKDAAIAKLQREMKKGESLETDSAHELSQLQNANAEHERTIAKLIRDLADANDNAKNLAAEQAKLGDLEKELQDKNQALEKLQSGERHAKEVIAKAQQTIVELERRVQAAHDNEAGQTAAGAAVSERDKTIAQLRSQMKTGAEQSAKQRQAVAEQEAAVARDAVAQKSTHEKLENALRDRNATIAQLRTQVESVREKSAKQEKADAQQVAAVARDDVAQKAAHEKLQNAVRERDATIAQLRTQIKNVREQNAKREQADAEKERAVANDAAQRDGTHEELMKVVREQEATIAGLSEQIRQLLQPAPKRKTPPAPDSQESGDLFDRPASMRDAPDGDADDLKQISGVGPVLENKLNEMGVFHFRQIAGFSEEDIAWVAAQLQPFSNRIVRDRWVDQAIVLNELQDG